MLIIGLVLIAAAAAVGIEITAMNNVSIDVDAFNQLYSTSIAMVFVAGVVTALAGVLGVMLVHDGLIRRRRRHREAVEEETRREQRMAELEEEHAARRRAEVESRTNETAGTDNAASIDLREKIQAERDRERERARVTTF